VPVVARDDVDPRRRIEIDLAEVTEVADPQVLEEEVGQGA